MNPEVQFIFQNVCHKLSPRIFHSNDTVILLYYINFSSQKSFLSYQILYRLHKAKEYLAGGKGFTLQNFGTNARSSAS